MLTLQEIKHNEEINAYIRRSDEAMSAMGFTEHSFAHAGCVSRRAGDILKELGYDAHTVSLAEVAGYIHDIGNAVNRVGHAQSGAAMAFALLRDLGAPPEDIGVILSAIGNHDESAAYPPDAVAAALILADKSDVRRSRVRNRDIPSFDIHDRVNYAAEKSELTVNRRSRVITLSLTIDTAISPVMNYFEIFLDRMLLCRRAANMLKVEFRLVINGQAML